MESADLTVIIPCYNSEGTIEKAVNSILEQELLPIKVFLVNDCSQDDTLNILLDLKEKITKFEVEVINLEVNQGPSYARNIAWDLVTSDYIAFLDADDTWHPKKVLYQYNFMLEKKDCIISGHKMLFKESNIKSDIIFENISLSQLLYKNLFPTPSVMLKTSIDLRFDIKKKYSEDYLLWLLIVAKYPLSAYYSASNLASLQKPSYGFSGLSSNLWLMQQGELDNFKKLHEDQYLSFIKYLYISMFSYMKFFRRVILNSIRKLLT